MFSKHKETCVFMTRNFWLEMKVPMYLVRQKYKYYFGEEDLIISERTKAVEKLTSIIDRLQLDFVNWLKSENPNSVIMDLYKILDECFWFYLSQRKVREKLSKLRLVYGDFQETLEHNRNMSRNVIDAVNLWVENCLLYQDSLDKPSDSKSFDVNYELFIDLYIYGLVSKDLSLLNLSKKFGDDVLFYGIHITPNDVEPMEILRYHPVIYFNTLVAGNQDVFDISPDEYKNAGNSEFGLGFKDEYGIDFFLAIRTMEMLQKKMLKGGKYAYVVVEKNDFIKWVDTYTNNKVDGELFFDTFVLTKKKIQSQIKRKDPIIWVMNTNKFRHEIRPFVCLNNDRIAIAYTALEQAKQLWLSYFANGGMIYSNSKDQLTDAISKRNEELSNKLVRILREKLQEHYEADFDEVDVQYDRIFGVKPDNYGDYDLIFYSKKNNELFLIEAKFFSDSLSNSGVVTDYEKLFKDKGYYEHCRKRYDLVLSEPEKIKSFIGAENSVNVHFLFVSSKPLEIEFVDADGIVCFPCLSIFDDYLEGKLLPEVGENPVRPTHTI